MKDQNNYIKEREIPRWSLITIIKITTELEKDHVKATELEWWTKFIHCNLSSVPSLLNSMAEENCSVNYSRITSDIKCKIQ